MEELIYHNNKKIMHVVITSDSVLFNGKYVAKRYYTRDSIKYGALGTTKTKIEAEKLIKKRREIFGNQYKHFTKKASGRYIVYVGSNKKKK